MERALRVVLYVMLAGCEVGVFVEAAHGHAFVGPSGFALLVVAGLLFPGWCRPRGLSRCTCGQFRPGPPPDVPPDPARRLPSGGPAGRR